MMPAGSPPPFAWQSDLQKRDDALQAAQSGPSLDSGRRFQSSENISEAYRHATEVAQCRREADLYDLLSATRREDTYQPYVPLWPSLLKPLSTTLMELPAMVQEKFRACQTMCFCGLFPQLRRAWASIDNCLYLWRYDISGDVPIEVGGVDQAICAVGLARPTPNIFVAGVQHLLVLCTPVEVILMGVCAVPRGGGGGEQRDDLTVQPLPRYSVPSDNVVMTSVASTAGGRIFLGGADGHVYELRYGAADTWRSKKCSKVRITSSLQQYLPGFVPYMFGLRPPSAVDSLCVDLERHILYALSQSGAIQVFDLGGGGTEPARRAAEVPDFYHAAASAAGGKELFRGSSDRKGSAVRHIAPIAQSESSKLHLLAVTADGRRVYFTTLSSLRSTSASYPSSSAAGSQAALESGPRPMALVAVHARPALPHAGVSLGRIASADMSRSVAPEVVCALYAHGCLLLSEAGGSDGRTTRLQMASRNLLLPAASVNTNASSGASGLRELVTELDNYIPGQTCAMCAAPQSTSLGPEAQRSTHDDLTGQLFSPPPRFVLISTAGVVELEKRRPLEVLAEVLQDRGVGRLKTFFDNYGPCEAAAMCCALATARPGSVNATVHREAAAALDNPDLVGSPRMPEDLLLGQQPSAESARGAGIFMGQPVNPNPEPDWSAAHKGVCLYLLRVLQPVWEQPLLVSASRAQPQLLVCRLSTATMAVVQDKLQCLDAFLGDILTRRQHRGHKGRYATTAPGAAAGGTGRTLFGLGDGDHWGGGAADNRGAVDASKRQRLTHAAVLEDERMARTRALAAKAAEALALLRILHDHNLGRLALRLSDPAQRTLRGMVVRDMVYDPAGEAVLGNLISQLVTQQLGAAPSAGGPGAVVGSMESVARQLQEQCPMYFKEPDRVYYQASAKLTAAHSASGSQREAMVRDAVAHYLRVPTVCDLEYVTTQLALLKHYQGIVEIPLAAATAYDPGHLALRPELGAACEDARQQRSACYAHILQALRSLAASPSANGGASSTPAPELSTSERVACKAAILKAAMHSSDVYFQEVLYGALFDMGAVDDLLGRPWPYLDAYLEKEGSGLREGGLATASAALASSTGHSEPVPVGPLSRRQVALLELLSRSLIGRKRFHQAAGVYHVLAARRSGAGEAAVSLDERVGAYQSALLQAKSDGDSQLVAKLEGDAKVATIQRSIAQRLQAQIAGVAGAGTDGAAGAELERLLAELQQGLRDVSELYNDYAQPLKMWGLCLQLVDFSGGEMDPGLIRTLWDHALLAAWGQAPQLATRPVRLARAAECAEELGAQFFPNETSFPTTHVAFRLEQMAAGLWGGPAPSGGAEASGSFDDRQDEDVVPLAMSRACRDSLAAAQRTYDLLLNRRAPGVPDAPLASPRLRTQLLASLLVLVRHQAQAVQSVVGAGGLYAGGPSSREAAALSDACDKFAHAARRLGGPQCEGLARAFDDVKQSLDQQ